MEMDTYPYPSRIITTAPYGQHIDLYCVNHPEKRWFTKNISHIGARTIFAAKEKYTVIDNKIVNLYECSCPMSDLRPCANLRDDKSIDELDMLK